MLSALAVLVLLFASPTWALRAYLVPVSLLAAVLELLRCRDKE